MKETVVAILTNQMVNGVCNNVNFLNTPENQRLLHSLQDESQSEMHTFVVYFILIV